MGSRHASNRAARKRAVGLPASVSRPSTRRTCQLFTVLINRPGEEANPSGAAHRRGLRRHLTAADDLCRDPTADAYELISWSTNTMAVEKLDRLKLPYLQQQIWKLI